MSERVIGEVYMWGAYRACDDCLLRHKAYKTQGARGVFHIMEDGE